MKDTVKFIEQKLWPRELKRSKMLTYYDDRADPEAIKNLEKVHADAKEYINRFKKPATR